VHDHSFHPPPLLVLRDGNQDHFLGLKTARPYHNISMVAKDMIKLELNDLPIRDNKSVFVFPALCVSLVEFTHFCNRAQGH